MEYSGVVKDLIFKQWNGKTFYSITLINQDSLFGCGMIKPKVKAGDTINFEAEKNEKGYWQVTKGSLEVTASTEKVAVKPSAGFVSKDEYWARKDLRDVRQDELREIGATRNTAVEWIKFLFEKEALKLPAKVAEREEYLNALLADYIAKFRKAAHKDEDNQKPAKEVAEASPVAAKTANEEEVPWE